MTRASTSRPPSSVPSQFHSRSRQDAVAAGKPRLLGDRLAHAFGKTPGRRRRRGCGKVEVDGVRGETDGRPDGPAVLLDLLDDDGIAIVGLRQEAAELLLRIVDEDRHQQLALVAHENRPVIGEELGEKAEHEQDHEDPERPIARAGWRGNWRAAARSWATARNSPLRGKGGASRAPVGGASGGAMRASAISAMLTPPASRNRCGDRSTCR